MEEDQTQAQPPDPNSPGHSSERSEPVRSRWTPKPEQILILESIFNSGMVNPPKDETVRIRKLLEKFGSVGDANVFYWFQNRRSRSRRRQRQLQAQAQASYGNSNTATGAIQFENGCGAPAASAAMGLLPATSCSPPATFGSSQSPSFLVGSPSSSTSCGSDNGAESLFPMPAQVGFQQIGESSSILCPTGGSQNFQYQSDSITVFINGVATAVPRGPIDIKAAFGEDVMLVHSSGFPLPMNDFGCLLHSLQHGESYFLVSRAS